LTGDQDGLRLATQRNTRIEALDLVRVLAMVLMIEGHTLDALLDPAYRSSYWYDLWLFCRGFTAPTFMLLSGFSFVLGTSRRWQEHLALTSTVVRRVRRFGFFLLLGYILHFPVHRISDFRTLPPEGWAGWMQADVLQAIGASLLMLQALVWVSRTPERFTKLSLGLAGAIVMASPAIWASGWSRHLPAALAAYVDGATGSPFPLFPWAAYLLLGAGVGGLYVCSPGLSSPALARRLLWGGTGLLALGTALAGPALAFYGEAIFWKTSPTLFAVRTGVVLLLMGGMLLVTHLSEFSGRTVRSLAQESLFVYFAHVCLVYGSIWNPGFKQHLAALGPLQALLLAGVLILAVMGIALLWHDLKKRRRLPVLALRTAVCMAAAWSLL
jgi:uncharacterized membrane protein